MDTTSEAGRGPVASRVGLELWSWLGGVERRLRPYRPRYRDRRFWAVQGLVLLIGAVHTGVEVFDVLQPLAAGSHPLAFVPTALFLVPVVYAALNFGFAGSMATALWCVVLTLPNVALFHHGAERAAELLQLGVVLAVAAFVGQRVDREVLARERAETARTALGASERKYHGLFESSPVPILVLDSPGKVLEANPAARVLFSRSHGLLEGMPVADLLGAACAAELTDPLGDSRCSEVGLMLAAGGPQVYLEPSFTRTSDREGKLVLQVLLRDVTEERQRRAGLKAYAASILQAQEDERKRIAQELHDETVQQLVLVCRQLDALETLSDSWPASAIEGLAEIRRTTESVSEELRDFARALRPPTLDDLGLVTCIRRLVVDLSDRTGIEGEVHVAGQERRLPLDTELVLFRIAQEALRNVERHACADRVAITLSFGRRECRLEVVDDGVGFMPPPAANFAAHRQLGLIGMRERAESLGGSLKLRSNADKGTRVAVAIPLPPTPRGGPKPPRR